MKDRLVEHPNRYKLKPVAGESGVYDLEPMPGVVTEVGTPLNKGTLLSDEVAELYGNVETVNDVLGGIKTLNLVYVKTSCKVVIPKNVKSFSAYLVGGGGHGLTGVANSGYPTSGEGAAIFMEENIVPYNYANREDSEYDAIIGAAGLGNTSLSHNMIQYTTEGVANTGKSSGVTKIGPLSLCPFDGKFYGVSGANQGTWSSPYAQSVGDGHNGIINGVTLTKGGTSASARDKAASGGGASANNNGSDATIGSNNCYGGDGGDALPNTGNGGGGGGGIYERYASTLQKAGQGGLGGSGIIILRLEQV